jgi:hypothetical protein
MCSRRWIHDPARIIKRQCETASQQVFLRLATHPESDGTMACAPKPAQYPLGKERYSRRKKSRMQPTLNWTLSPRGFPKQHRCGAGPDLTTNPS